LNSIDISNIHTYSNSPPKGAPTWSQQEAHGVGQPNKSHSTENRQSARETNETGKCRNLKSLTQNQALERKHLWANSTTSQTRNHHSQVQRDHATKHTSLSASLHMLAQHAAIPRVVMCAYTDFGTGNAGLSDAGTTSYDAFNPLPPYTFRRHILSVTYQAATGQPLR
jgi:hypothetical protein